MCMVLSHPLRMLFVIFPVHKLHFNYTSFLVFFAVLVFFAPKLVCVIFNNNNNNNNRTVPSVPHRTVG